MLCTNRGYVSTLITKSIHIVWDQLPSVILDADFSAFILIPSDEWLQKDTSATVTIPGFGSIVEEDEIVAADYAWKPNNVTIRCCSDSIYVLPTIVDIQGLGAVEEIYLKDSEGEMPSFMTLNLKERKIIIKLDSEKEKELLGTYTFTATLTENTETYTSEFEFEI